MADYIFELVCRKARYWKSEKCFHANLPSCSAVLESSAASVLKYLLNHVQQSYCALVPDGIHGILQDSGTGKCIICVT